jgi:ribose transport system permease protein
MSEQTEPRAGTAPAPAAARPPAPPAPSAPSRLRRFATSPTTPILFILAALVIGFTAGAPGVFNATGNIRNLLLDSSILLVIAVGATYVVITAGIDLSVGSVLVFSGVVAAKLMEQIGGGGTGTLLLGLLAAVASGLAWGLLNGALVGWCRIPALIVTLGTLGMALGFALILTGGSDVRTVPTELVDGLGTGRIFGELPYLVLVAAAVALVGGVLLALTRFGRHTYAIGSNPEAARRAGIHVERHLLKVYGLAGALAGFAGFLSLARFSTTSIGGHATDNLQAITAVVLGGTSLFGGIGTILGTVIGTFIPAVLQNGFVVVGLEPFWQQVAVGAILIAAVYLDQRRRSQR